MSTEGENIKYIKINNDEYSFDALYMNGKLSSEYLSKSNLVQSIDENSTDEQYPSAKCLYDIFGDLSKITGTDTDTNIQVGYFSSDSNDIILNNLSSGTYTLYYEDENDNKLENFGSLGTVTQ